MSSATTPSARLAKLCAWAAGYYRDRPKSGRIKHFLDVAGDAVARSQAILAATPRPDRLAEYDRLRPELERALAVIADLGQLFSNVKKRPDRSTLPGKKV